MPEFRPFDYGQAVAQGQANALRAAQMGEVVREVQGRNMLSELAKRGIEGPAKLDILNRSGRPDLAEREQGKMMQREIDRRKMFIEGSRFIRDQNSYERFIQNSERLGLAQPGEIQQLFGNQWTPDMETRLRKLRGDFNYQIQQLTTNLPQGRARDDRYQGGVLMERGPEYERFSPRQRGAGAGGRGGFTPATINQYKLDQAKEALGKIEDFVDSGNEDAQIAWINAFERFTRQGIDTGTATRWATDEIKRNSQTEQGRLWGVRKTYDPTKATAPLTPEEEAELAELEREFGGP